MTEAPDALSDPARLRLKVTDVFTELKALCIEHCRIREAQVLGPMKGCCGQWPLKRSLV